MMNELTMPIGWVDLMTSCTQITGWAYDPTSGQNPIWVHVYRDGHYIGAAHANQSRPEIISRVPTTDHGWTFDIPQHLRDGKPHTFQVFAINDTGYGPNPPLEHEAGITNFTLHCGPVGTVPLYRMEDTSVKRMLLTTNNQEALSWQVRGHIGWVPPGPQNGSQGLFRGLRNGYPWNHFFTWSLAEYMTLHSPWWIRESGHDGSYVSFTVFTSQRPGTVPMYRMYSHGRGVHNYVFHHEIHDRQNKGFHLENGGQPYFWVYPAN